MSDTTDRPNEPTPFQKFERLARALVQIPKKELNEKQREVEAEREVKAEAKDGLSP